MSNTSKPTGAVWHLAGEIGIDTGTCWIGDPGYVLPQEVEGLQAETLTWPMFLAAESKAGYPLVHQWQYRKGHPGLGVSVRTGWGDGRYPVYVRYDPETGRVAAVKVVFIEDDEEEQDEGTGNVPVG